MSGLLFRHLSQFFLKIIMNIDNKKDNYSFYCYNTAKKFF